MFCKEKLKDAIYGLAIADACGVPGEFKPREYLKSCPITDMIGNVGCWRQPTGTWSDDTSMTLALLDALKNNNYEYSKEVLTQTMENFISWYRVGIFASNMNRFDIGNTCRLAIQNFENKRDVYKCGIKDINSCGNGALMRILPMAFLDYKNDKELIKAIDEVTSLTHANAICSETSIIYIKFVRELLNGKTKEEAFENIIKYCQNVSILVGFLKVINPFERIDNNFHNIEERKIQSTGYCVHTLEAALWCFLNSNSYEECILKAINLGDDTDTTAAVVGGICGVYYGFDNIPTKWVDKLLDKETIDNLL